MYESADIIIQPTIDHPSNLNVNDNDNDNDDDDDIIVLDNDNDIHNDMNIIKITLKNGHLQRPTYILRQKNITEIEQSFRTMNWFLLRTYASTENNMYLCHRDEYERNIIPQIYQSTTYRLIESNSNIIPSHLKKTIHSIVFTFDHLLNEKKSLTQLEYNEMIGNVNLQEMQFNQLYFQPDVRSKKVIYRPRTSFQMKLTKNIEDYLFRFLQPLYQHSLVGTKHKIVRNSMDLMEQINHQSITTTTTTSKTLFCTVDFEDLYQVLDFERLSMALSIFLEQCNSTSETILTLVRLILQTQYVLFEDKLYRQVKGGNPDSPLIHLLFEIYLYYIQRDLFDYFNERDEFIVRFENKIFIISTASRRSLSNKLSRFKKGQALSQLTINSTISTTAQWLNIAFSQPKDSSIQTKLIHPLYIHIFKIPFNRTTTDQQQQIKTEILHILTSIVLCSSQLTDFHEQFQGLFSCCIYNRYPLNFIQECMNNFFQQINPSKSNQKYSQQTYHDTRQHLFQTMVSSSSSSSSKRKHSPSDTLSIKKLKI